MKRSIPHTAIARAAAALLALVALPAAAGNMLLPNGTVCTFSGITVQMDGTMVLACPPVSGGGATPAVYISAPMQIPVSPSATGMLGGAPMMGAMPAAVYIIATGNVSGSVDVMYDIAGTGCYANGFAPPAMGGVTIASGTMQSPAIGIVATYPGSICSVAITTVSPMGAVTIAPMSGMQSSRVDIPVGF